MTAITLPTPIIITTSNTISKIDIQVILVVLFERVELSVAYVDINNEIVKRKGLILSGVDYDNWANDDQYIIDYVMANLE